MSNSLTVRLDDDLARALDRVAEASGKSRSEIVREALRRRLAPLAEARGWLTDEDVLENVS